MLAIAGGTELVTKILQVFFQKETTPSSKVIIIVGIGVVMLSSLRVIVIVNHCQPYVVRISPSW